MQGELHAMEKVAEARFGSAVPYESAGILGSPNWFSIAMNQATGAATCVPLS